MRTGQEPFNTNTHKGFLLCKIKYYRIRSVFWVKLGEVAASIVSDGILGVTTYFKKVHTFECQADGFAQSVIKYQKQLYCTIISA